MEAQVLDINEVKCRNPNRRPLPVDKEVFARLQETQRLQRGRHDFPEFDLGFLGTAALRIVFALPDADERILEQVCIDFRQKLSHRNGST